MEFVKTTFEGKEYKGVFSHWFNCDLTNDKIGVITCEDGKDRAFNFDKIIDDNEAIEPMHNVGCNCYRCL
jgi:hypothetical protein